MLLHQLEQRLAFFSLVKAQQSPPPSVLLPRKEAIDSFYVSKHCLRSTGKTMQNQQKTAFSSYENAFFVLLLQQEHRLAFFSLVKAQQSPPVSCCLGKKRLTLSIKTTLFRSTVSEALAKPTQTAFSSYENAFFVLLHQQEQRLAFFSLVKAQQSPPRVFLPRKEGIDSFYQNHAVSKHCLRSTCKTQQRQHFRATKMHFLVFLH